ncbi:unnamed protein product [Rhodiola kirilowii]
MAAAADTLDSGIPKKNEEWTVVLPRRGKQRRSLLELKATELHQGECAPADADINPEREAKLFQKMKTCMEAMKSSQFCTAFLDQIQSKLIDSFFRVLGSEPNMEMIIYGIGSIEAYENPRVQLSLALLMKEKFDWIGDVEVFDPVLSATETRVIKSFGLTVITLNEEGKRQALKPTFFFMPHCDLSLYNNLVLANWSPQMLNRVALFGNSFKAYEELAFVFKSQKTYLNGRHVLAAQKYIEEYEVKTVTEDYFRPFTGSSWHFFKCGSEEELPHPEAGTLN